MTQITPFTAVPNRGQSQEALVTTTNTWFSEVSGFVEEANALIGDINTSAESSLFSAPDWVAQAYAAHKTVVYTDSNVYISKEAVLATDVPSVSDKWKKLNYEAVPLNTYTVGESVNYGDSLAVSSDGKLYKVKLTSSTPYIRDSINFGVYDGSNNTGFKSTLVKIDANTVALIYLQREDTTAVYTACIIGKITVSGISWSLPCLFYQTLGAKIKSATYNSAKNMILVLMNDTQIVSFLLNDSKDSAAYIKYAAYTASAFTEIGAIISHPTQEFILAFGRDSTGNYFIAASYRVSNLYHLTGTAIATRTLFGVAMASESFTNAVYDASTGYYCCAGRSTTNYEYLARVLMYDGTASLGGDATLSGTNYMSGGSLACNNNGVVLYCRLVASNTRVTAVSLSTFSWGSENTISIGNNTQCGCNPITGEFLLVNSASKNVWTATVSFPTTTISSAYNLPNMIVAYDSETAKGGPLLCFEDFNIFAISLDGFSSFKTKTSNLGKFIGFSSASVSANADVVVLKDSDELNYSAVAGTTYYIKEDGTITTLNTGVQIGKAVETNKIIIKVK